MQHLRLVLLCRSVRCIYGVREKLNTQVLTCSTILQDVSAESKDTSTLHERPSSARASDQNEDTEAAQSQSFGQPAARSQQPDTADSACEDADAVVKEVVSENIEPARFEASNGGQNVTGQNLGGQSDAVIPRGGSQGDTQRRAIVPRLRRK